VKKARELKLVNMFCICVCLDCNSSKTIMSSSSRYPWNFDVFISFRGEDTRNNFVSHLYSALKNSGVNAFLDDKKLGKGEELGLELRKAIGGSPISIVVLSPNYARSSWCLNELGMRENLWLGCFSGILQCRPIACP